MNRAKLLTGVGVVVAAFGSYWLAATSTAPPVEHQFARDIPAVVASAASGRR